MNWPRSAICSVPASPLPHLLSMLSPIRVFGLLAFVLTNASLHQAVESRSLLSTNFNLETSTLQRQSPAQQQQSPAPDSNLSDRIQSYFKGSGFPKAGRSLQQKIKETDAFLSEQLAKADAVGVSTAIVYKDQVVYTKGFGLRRYNDSHSTVTKDDIFQIGSVSKTHIALGVGLLVEDGKVQWTDQVKKHVPWLKLLDKYAEEHVRIGDLLSMNSGFGRSQDPVLDSGGYDTARHLVEGLKFAEPDHPLRDTPAYANINYVILGVLIEEVSGKPWLKFLEERLWKPLGMNHKFGDVADVPLNLRKTNLNAGHVVCEKNVIGPLEMINNPVTNVSPGFKYDASGTIVSSAADMAKFLRLILNKGTVDIVKLFRSRSTIAEMITGKNKAIDELFLNLDLLPVLGYEFFPDGNSLSSGYGFDVVGNLLWGHAYMDKGGSTVVHLAATGFAPNDDLALVMLSNSQGDMSFVKNQLRSYVMGIFLDVPKEILDYQFAQLQAKIPPRRELIPGAPKCGFSFWKNAPHLTLSSAQMDAFVGEYQATTSTTYMPQLTITRASVANGLVMRNGQLNTTVFWVGTDDTTMILLPEGDMSVHFIVIAVPDQQHPGNYIVNVVNQDYRKQ